MKNRLFICFCLLILSACTNNVDSGALRSFVKDNLKGDKGILDLGNYKDADWDKMYVLGPFTNERVLMLF